MKQNKKKIKDKKVELIKEEVYFKSLYNKPPIVIGFVERLKGNKEFPRYLIPTNMIECDGFYFFHEEYNKKEFKFYFKVLEQVESYKELIKI